MPALSNVRESFRTRTRYLWTKFLVGNPSTHLQKTVKDIKKQWIGCFFCSGQRPKVQLKILRNCSRFLQLAAEIHQTLTFCCVALLLQILNGRWSGVTKCYYQIRTGNSWWSNIWRTYIPWVNMMMIYHHIGMTIWVYHHSNIHFFYFLHSTSLSQLILPSGLVGKTVVFSHPSRWPRKQDSHGITARQP